MGALLSALAALALTTAAPPATAPDPCHGPAAHVGQVVRGAVLHVFDGRHLCVAAHPGADSWTELELDPRTPVLSPSDELSRAGLMSVAFARTAECAVVAAADGRPVARCSIDGAPLEGLLARPGAVERASAWLPRVPAGQTVLVAAGR